MVSELLAIERGGAAEESTYLCPCRKQTREHLAGVVREQGIESVSELSAACGAGRDCGACKPGLAYLVSEVCGNRHREERHARYINDRVHANIQRDGTFSVIPRMRGGVTTPDELRRIADVADKYEVPMVKVTGGQRIDLLGVRKENLPAIWEELGMPSGHAYAKAVRTVKTCVGTDFCRFGLGNSIGLGIELETAMEGLYTPHKVKSAVTGCPRNCAEAYVKDIGLVAVEGGWEIYVGGAAGATVRKGDLLASVQTPEEAKRLALVFLQHYRENAEYLERTYGYVERVGIDAVRDAVLDPERAEAYLERYRIAKSAADPDPWRERHAPVHPKQFAELDSSPALVGPRPEARCERARLGPGRPGRRRPAARGPQRALRPVARGDLPPARRLGRRPARLPAPGRPAPGRHRRRHLRDLPAARVAVRPAQRPPRRRRGTARHVRGARARRDARAPRARRARVRRGGVSREVHTQCPYCGVAAA